ncbi:Ltp family lipoprotein [Arthrobacter sp. NPDC080031]|uniref:Ltp family lipoprotein n=1 Tax=Arthrobacter sp. NPDC080031 TaxID=3155918 RepID=UPI0034502350
MTENNTQIDKKSVKSNAKAQAAADKAYRKASRPWFKKKRFIFPLILVVIIIISSVAANSGKKDTAATSPAATSSTQAAGPAAPSGTAAQLQALAAAKGYLDSGMGFSQASLTKQLTSSAGNGFAQADAQWAVDHAGADWNGQALKAAKGYLTSGMGFSQASLTKQLTSSAGNEFTAPQAESAVANSGADWNAEAVKAAKGYMTSGMGFSRQSLIAQLTSPAGNQFTDAQAGYAADQVGLK